MNFELFVSLRYLLAKRRQTFISLITLISIMGVAVGVMALIVVLAVMNGFQQDLKTRILGITSHVLTGRFDGFVTNYRAAMEEIKHDQGVVASSPFIYTQVMLSSGKGVAGAVLRGIDPHTAGQVTNIKRNLIRGSLNDLILPEAESPSVTPNPGIILGSELAGNLAVQQDDYVTVVSPTGRLTPLGQSPRSRLFRVVGIFQSGMFEYDNTLAYVGLAAAQQLLGLGDVASGLEVSVTDIYQAQEVAQKVRARLGSAFWVRDWMQMNRSLFSALKLEKVVMFIILTLIVLVAAFNIVGSLIMLVIEKTRDIAILKAMGATTSTIRKIFVLEGLIIGCSGTVFGMLGGFALCALLKKYQFIDLPPSIYYLSKLPVQMEPLDVAAVAFSAVVISLVATLYPSRQAAKLDPVEALRYE